MFYGQDEDGLSAKALSNYKNRLSLFLSIIGDKAINTLKRADALEYKNILVKLPPNLTRDPKYKNKSYKQVAEMDTPTLGTHTINDNVKVVSGFFDWCVLNEKAEKNSFTKLQVKHNGKPSDQRKAFTKSDLKKIFSLDAFKTAHKETWHYWIPILGLYTGARLNELCQLHKNDIQQIDGIWCIKFQTEQPDQKLKTKSSYRTIPIHQKLKNLGFIEYVSQQKERVFPTLKFIEGDGYGKYPSKWFSVQRDKVLTQAERDKKTYHSLRHTVATEFKQMDVSYHHASAILGHHNESMTYGHYGKDYTPKILKAIIDKLDFDIEVNCWSALVG